MYVCIYIYMYTDMYIYIERERDTDSYVCAWTPEETLHPKTKPGQRSVGGTAGTAAAAEAKHTCALD